MWSVLFGWTNVGIAVGLLVSAGFGVMSMSPPQHTLAQVFFSMSMFFIIARTAWWVAFESRAKSSFQAALFCFIVFGVIGALWYAAVHWVQGLRPKEAPSTFTTLSHVGIAREIADDVVAKIAANDFAGSNPIIEAQLKQIQKIDEFLLEKDEVGLRETFDFPSMLKYNIRLVKRSIDPKSISKEQSADLDHFFKNGQAILDARYSRISHPHNRIHAEGIPGKVFIINTSPKYIAARKSLLELYSSARLPDTIGATLRGFSKALDDNASLMVESLNDSLAEDARNVVDDDNVSSDRAGSASGLYWSRFIQLRPKAEAIASVVRSYLATQ